MKTVTIILPAYNEESSFELLKERMGEVLKQNPDYNWEFLLVNDGSSDHTLQQMMRLHLQLSGPEPQLRQGDSDDGWF